MTRLLPMLLLACATAEAPSVDTATEYRRRADDGWSPCVGARPSGCGRCPEGQNALWRRKSDGSIEVGCFDEATGEKVGTPSIRRPQTRTGTGREVVDG